MSDSDPLDTEQRSPSPTTELAGAGFHDVHEIGRDRYGVSYRCVENDLNRTVAVKVLIADFDEQRRANFFREQRSVARLTGHPNIVDVLRIGATHNGLPYMVMPYPRYSLEERIRRFGLLSLGDALRLGVKMAGAVESAHRLGILHCGIEPSNILLSDSGDPELAHFGIAHFVGGFETDVESVTRSQAYTAPEVISGDPPSKSADVYGLCATLFSALTGHADFERRSGEQVDAKLSQDATSLLLILREHGVPDDMSAVIARGMVRTSDQRTATAADLGEELRQLQRRHGLPVDAMTLGTLPGTEINDDIGPPKIAPVSSSQTARVPFSTGKMNGFSQQLTSFVGRRREATRAKNLLSRSRLVTLTGIGGVGKTRLAIRVAENVKNEYPDGARFVELGELRDTSSLVEAIALAVGAQDQFLHPQRKVLAQHLAAKDLLLVLDNCEHLVEKIAELASFLLHSCERLRILATSREALRIGGELVLRVPPLTCPTPEQQLSLRGLSKYDAIVLFAERAAATVPGFEVTDDNIGKVAEICHRLDGLPLPIELAAARLRAMSVKQLAQGLADRYTLLTRGSRDLPTRQQTLRLCIDWSFELCTVREQLVWSRLSVFAGSFELDAAAQVCGNDLLPDEFLNALTSLVDKSILIREEHGPVVRFRLLETLRDYGSEKLKNNEDEVALRRRHRDWYLALVLDAESNWISPDQIDWIDRLKREQANVRESLEFSIEDSPESGLRIAAALFLFWSSQGLFNEGRCWTTLLLDKQSGPPTRAWVEALYNASVIANVQGDLEAATRFVNEGHRIGDKTSDPHMRAFIAYADGMLALYKGDPVGASQCLETAVTEFRSCGSRTFEVTSLYPLGLSYELSNQSRRALECHERVLSITKAHGEKMYRSYSLWALGIASWRRGDTSRAVDLLEQTLELTLLVGSARTAALAIETLAWINCELSLLRRSAILLGTSEGLAHSINNLVVIHSNFVVYHENCEKLLRTKLGDATFNALHHKGWRLGFEEGIAFALRDELPSPSRSLIGAPVSLTKRERQVADLVAKGLTNQGIADRLVISRRTVQGHVEHILTKLDFTSRTQVATWVVETEGT